MSRISHPDPTTNTTTTHQRRRLPSSTPTNPGSTSQSRIFQPLHLDPSTSQTQTQAQGPPPESLFRSRLSANGSGFRERERERTSTSQSSRRLSSNTRIGGGENGSSGFNSRHGSKSRGWEESGQSESGMSGFSAFSAFPDPSELGRRKREKRTRRREKEARRLLESEEWEKGEGRRFDQEEEKGGVDPTDSPLRRWVRWMLGNNGATTTIGWDRWKCFGVCVALVVVVKCQVGLGGYSGLGTPPLRGDFEAQRHWISITSSSLSSLSSLSIPFTRISIPLYHPPSTVVVRVKEWYSHDLSYWGLDYPPLTAYHSYLLGLIARLSPSTAPYVTLRPHSQNSTVEELAQWEREMERLEKGGGMKQFMRSTVVGGDLVLWVTAVGWYCWWNFGRSASSSSATSREKGMRSGISEKALRRTIVASLTILLQPALILIDNGHFQYNSLMLALTLWSINAFQSGHDLIGSVLFVASLGFKQMALYYAPGVFAYLLGKCLWLGGREGVNLFLHLGLTVVLSFTLLFLPFLTPFPTSILQALDRIFPFARGLFEDKVANFWCTLNIVIKLRNLASVSTLARLSLVMTGIAVLPSTLGVVWISYRLGQRSTSSSSPSSSSSSSSLAVVVAKNPNRPAPTSHLLPHLLLTSSLSFFLFSFQVHEKSILLPLMPLTLLMGAREKGYGRLDWEWGVLMNNVAVFSMFPLLKKDGLIVQYVALTLLWNFLIGYNPLKLRSNSFVKLLSLTAYCAIFILHSLEFLTTPPPHLPDLFPVLNMTVSAGVFGLAWLWGGKRLAQESWAIGGF